MNNLTTVDTSESRTSHKSQVTCEPIFKTS